MHYKLLYERLVQRCLERDNSSECYIERHHIIPRCMGGGDEKENLVEMTPEEHYVAHQLLVKIHPGNHSLVKAVHCMTLLSNCPGRNNKAYGWIKREVYKHSKNKQIECATCGKCFWMYTGGLVRVKYCSKKCYRLPGKLPHSHYLKQLGKRVKDLTTEERIEYNNLANSYRYKVKNDWYKQYYSANTDEFRRRNEERRRSVVGVV